jgi:hypothetical protein
VSGGDAQTRPGAGARDLEVKIKARDLPQGVVELRKTAAERDAKLEEVVQPRIAGVIGTCRSLARQLQGWHASIADRTDLDLTGHSRASAIWLLSGRCLGLLEVLMVQAEAGIDNEATIVGRAIHEANRILFAFIADPDDDALVRVWLDDEGKYGYVKQGAARAVNDRFEEKLNAALVAQGLPAIGTTKAGSEELYDRLSRTVHNRRSSCVSSVWVAGRSMAYGIAPNPLRRATTAEWTAAVTVEVANAVGDALRAFFGDGFFVSDVAPLILEVEAVRQSLPLDETAIFEAANLPPWLQ